MAVCVTVTEAVSPAAIVEVVAETDNVSDDANVAADDGPELSNPRPSVATTASAMRLKVIFDIFFLSLVVVETFSNTAGEVKASPRDAMHVLPHHILRRVSGRDEEIQKWN
jgi:hypothetical protein